MNKKLLFGIMSLAAFAACSTDDFESQKATQEMAGSVEFEFVSDNDATTRAYMDGSTLRWEASKKDLFTLYHGAADPYTKGYENATYTTEPDENGGNAKLTTPTMIKAGGAIMVWPADTTFRITAADPLTITIPDKQTDIANQIPYVSDLINIGAYDEANGYSETLPVGNPSAWNTAGWNRKYPVYMRPMASQLTVKADYGITENEIKKLYAGGEEQPEDGGIEPIKVQSVSLITKAGGATLFTKTIPVKFTAPAALVPAVVPATQWTKAHNAWLKVTDFDVAGITAAGQVNELNTTCVTGNESSKFLILPQAEIAATGVEDAAVLVDTYYGKVLVADPATYKAGGIEDYGFSKYTPDEYNAAWYRIVSSVKAETADEKASTPVTVDGVAKHKVVAKSPKLGMKQTINDFSGHKAGSGTVKNEPTGYSLTRYLVVNLAHLDMSDLHIKTDKQLRDVARVWKKLGLDPVTVYLDGGTTGKFTITQKTIDVINSVNPADPAEPTFKVKPCQDADHGVCAQIVITENSGNATVKDVDFIAPGDGAQKVDVVFANETDAWSWTNAVKVDAAAVTKFINEGTMANAETKTIKTLNYAGNQIYVPLHNNGTWNVTAGTLNVQFSVTNNGTLNIKKGAQYRQDGPVATIFYNYATDKPSRFGGDDTKIGVVNNGGVFATVASGRIYNYGLIEHGKYPGEDYNDAAKTYITRNEISGTSDFANAFSGTNKMGRINLPWSNKEEDNISVNSALEQGFISVTVTSADAPSDGILNALVVGDKVNYVIVNSGISEIAAVSDQVKYLEINDPSKLEPNEIAWSVTTPTNYDGLMILSDVNIKLGTTINVTKATYLGADMYVGGTFNTTSYSGYYGDTSGNVATKYITY